MENQPKPAFTLDDLDGKLSYIYTRTMNGSKFLNDPLVSKDEILRGLSEANGVIQELLAIVVKKKQDQEAIEASIPASLAQEVITKAVGEERIQFYVSGVQLWENKILQGTSLYSTMIKAKKIRDILNHKFAELRVDHEAKILNYPVF
jgi:hypothetical protein